MEQSKIIDTLETYQRQLSIAIGLKLQGHSTSLKAQYLPSASAVSQMRFICLFTVYDATFQRFLMLHVKLGVVV